MKRSCILLFFAVLQEALGPAIKSVVEELEASHLRPTGILQRLQQGVNPACHGLCAQMGHLDSKCPKL